MIGMDFLARNLNLREEKLLLKTEYWGVFPDVGLQLLERGGHHPHGLIKSNAPIVECILAHS